MSVAEDVPASKGARFGKVCAEVARDGELSRTALRVYMEYALSADGKTGVSWESPERVATSLGYADASPVYKGLAELEQRGHIERGKMLYPSGKRVDAIRKLCPVSRNGGSPKLPSEQESRPPFLPSEQAIPAERACISCRAGRLYVPNEHIHAYPDKRSGSRKLGKERPLTDQLTDQLPEKISDHPKGRASRTAGNDMAITENLRPPTIPKAESGTARKTSPPAPPRPSAPMPFPAEFAIADELRHYASQHAPNVDVDRELEKCRQWAWGKGATSHDWQARFREWLLTAEDRLPGASKKYTAQRRADGTLERSERIPL